MLKTFLLTLTLLLMSSVSIAATCPDIATAIKQINGVAALSAPTGTSPYAYTGTSTYDNSEVDYYTTVPPTAVTPVYQLKSLAAALGVGLPLASANAVQVSCIYLGSWNGTTPQVDVGWGQAIVIKSNVAPTQQVAVSTDIEGLPNGATVKVTMTDSTGTPTSKTVNTGVSSFATLTVGSYTVVADNYTSGSDTYYPTLNNPYTIDSAHATVTINYATSPPPPPVTSMWFAPYKDFTYDMNWATSPPVSNLIATAQDSGATHFILAFIQADQHAANPCTASWGGNPAGTMGIGWGVDSIKQLRAMGGEIGISFGGEAGATMAHACTTVDELYAVYKNVMTTYNPAILDFDIEGTSEVDTDANTRRFQALAKLLQDYPNLKISLTLAANIQGLNPNGVHLAQQAHDLGVSIAYYNLMTMAWNAQKLPGPLYQSIVAAVTSATSKAQLGGIYTDKSSVQLLQMIRTTARLGIDTDGPPGSEFLISDVAPLVSAAKAGGWGGLAYWSMDVDANKHCQGLAPGQPSPGCTNTTTSPYAYTKAFLAAIGSGSQFDTQMQKK